MKTILCFFIVSFITSPFLCAQETHPLKDAIKQGNLSAVQTLLDDGGDPNTMLPNEEYPIHVALNNKQVEIAVLLLENGADPRRKNRQNQSPLDIITATGLAKAFWPVYRLIEADYPDEIRLQVPRMLDEAVSRDHRALLEAMLDQEEVLPKSTGVELKLFYKAAEHGSISVMKYFVEEGQDPHQQMPGTQWSALHFSAFGGHVQGVHWLLEQKAHVHNADVRGMTPLHLAVYRGHDTIAQTLLDAGAGVDETDESKRTPLHIATHHGYGAIIQILLNHGASPESKNAAGQTPLDIVHERNYPGLRTLFPLHTATPTKASSDFTDSMLELRIAIQKHQKERLSVLLASDELTLSETDAYGVALLHYASDMGDVDTIKALLAAGVAINQVDASSQWTPLMYAVAQGHTEAVEALLTAQADVQATNAAGWTALHLATFLGHSDLSSRLIEAGAKENARNELGHTPNQLAQTGRTYRDTQLMKAGAR